jgi:resuscitation-promoting factor RpfA
MPTNRTQRRTALRAAAVTTIALTAIVVVCQLRPANPAAAAAPEQAIVLSCAWLAWSLLSYLAVAVAATSLSRALAALGHGGERVARLAPRSLRHLVDAMITVSVATALLGTSAAGPASAAATHGAISTRGPRPASSGVLDWPGLPDPMPVLTPHPQRPPSADHDRPPIAAPARRSSPPARHQRAHVGLVSGGRASQPVSDEPVSDAGDVVVQAGDSLWKIAARHLGPGATAQATAIAWHQWFAANRQVVGDNPDLIHPGQRLRPPHHNVTH